MADPVQLEIRLDDAGPGAGRLSAWAPDAWPVADDWRPTLEHFWQSGPGRELAAFVTQRLAAGATIFPAQPLHALALTGLAQTKVVILGQDPYHGPGQAHGLAFSVPPGVAVPPSLRNIRTEIRRDAAASGAASSGGHTEPDAASDSPSGDLSRWARQGVLLLNTSLTVEQGLPGSHANKGWEVLTDMIIKAIWRKSSPLVSMAWGTPAQARLAAVGPAPAGAPRLCLQSNHPSPLSALRPPRPFIGCGHFGQANAFLRHHGVAPITW